MELLYIGIYCSFYNCVFATSRDNICKVSWIVHPCIPSTTPMCPAYIFGSLIPVVFSIATRRPPSHAGSRVAYGGNQLVIPMSPP